MVNNMSYTSSVNNMSYVNNMSFVNYLSIFMNHLDQILFFRIYKDEFETSKTKTKHIL